MFGVTYASTVASFPRAIFFLSMGLLLLCGIALSLVRIENHAVPDSESMARESEDWLGAGEETQEHAGASKPNLMM
jgi:hypothetical protein